MLQEWNIKCCSGRQPKSDSNMALFPELPTSNMVRQLDWFDISSRKSHRSNLKIPCLVQFQPFKIWPHQSAFFEEKETGFTVMLLGVRPAPNTQLFFKTTEHQGDAAIFCYVYCYVYPKFNVHVKTLDIENKWMLHGANNCVSVYVCARFVKQHDTAARSWGTFQGKHRRQTSVNSSHADSKGFF